jgi:hypothetical protein
LKNDIIFKVIKSIIAQNFSHRYINIVLASFHLAHRRLGFSGQQTIEIEAIQEAAQIGLRKPTAD